MNRIERVLDKTPGGVNARLRLVKKAAQRDPLLGLMRRLVRSGDVVVDAGANRGVYTLWLARRVGRRGRVHAIDPFPDNARVLRAATSRMPQVRVHGAALSDHAGVASLFVPTQAGRPIHALASLEEPDDGGTVDYTVTPVDVRPLDELVGDDGGRVGFIKCDVEGHEMAVLAGATSIIERAKPHIVVEIEQRHQDRNISDTIDQIKSWGYEGYAMFPHGLRPVREFDVQRDQLTYVTGDFVPYGMPTGYVSDFLFTRPGNDVSGLLG